MPMLHAEMLEEGGNLAVGIEGVERFFEVCVFAKRERTIASINIMFGLEIVDRISLVYGKLHGKSGHPFKSKSITVPNHYYGSQIKLIVVTDYRGLLSRSFCMIRSLR